ncbi:cytochrome P450 [Bisporella sp. PMI_857]|nr:cytochrome P450 [Bisporella sp. PMI_857]
MRLPLLSGIVKESLRLMHGIIIGPPRVTPPEGATIDGYYVPPNTVVTTSSYYSHVNPDVFPEPERFKPERWQNSTLEMERSLVPFSKGKRMCPGKELVLRLLSSSSVFNTTERDFEWKVYISLHFKGKLLHAHMKPRPEFSGTSSRFFGLQKMVSQF